MTLEEFMNVFLDLLVSKGFITEDENNKGKYLFEINKFNARGNISISASKVNDILSSVRPMELYEKTVLRLLDNSSEHIILHWCELAEKSLNPLEVEFLNANYKEVSNSLRTYVKFYFAEGLFDCDINVNIMVATEQEERDGFRHNNFSSNSKNEINLQSSLIWLAKQQNRIVDLHVNYKKYISRADTLEESVSYSILEEASSMHCKSKTSVLTFLVNMDMLQAFKLADLSSKRKRCEDIDNIVLNLPSDVVCGLFDMWDGRFAGFNIKLNSNVEIPLRMIIKVQYDKDYTSGYYTVGEVSNFVDNTWKRGLTAKNLTTNENIID